MLKECGFEYEPGRLLQQDNTAYNPSNMKLCRKLHFKINLKELKRLIKPCIWSSGWWSCFLFSSLTLSFAIVLDSSMFLPSSFCFEQKILQRKIKILEKCCCFSELCLCLCSGCLLNPSLNSFIKHLSLTVKFFGYFSSQTHPAIQ